MYKGQPKYNPEFHPNDLLEQMKLGKLNIQVIAEWGISKKTFYSWLNEHEELKEAYNQGEVACEAWWVDHIKEDYVNGRDKGYKYCNLIMNTKFGYKENQNSSSVTNNTLINVHGNINNIQEKSRDELIEFIKSGLEDNDIVQAEFKVLGGPDGSESKD
jgi:hypothetical protein